MTTLQTKSDLKDLVVPNSLYLCCVNINRGKRVECSPKRRVFLYPSHNRHCTPIGSVNAPQTLSVVLTIGKAVPIFVFTLLVSLTHSNCQRLCYKTTSWWSRLCRLSDYYSRPYKQICAKEVLDVHAEGLFSKFIDYHGVVRPILDEKHLNAKRFCTFVVPYKTKSGGITHKEGADFIPDFR